MAFFLQNIVKQFIPKERVWFNRDQFRWWEVGRNDVGVVRPWADAVGGARHAAGRGVALEFMNRPEEGLPTPDRCWPTVGDARVIGGPLLTVKKTDSENRREKSDPMPDGWSPTGGGLHVVCGAFISLK